MSTALSPETLHTPIRRPAYEMQPNDASQLFGLENIYASGEVPTVDDIEILLESDYAAVYPGETTEERHNAEQIKQSHPWVFNDEQYRIASIVAGREPGVVVDATTDTIIEKEFKRYKKIRNRNRENPGNSPLPSEASLLEDFQAITEKRLQLHDDYFATFGIPDPDEEKWLSRNPSFLPDMRGGLLPQFVRRTNSRDRNGATAVGGEQKRGVRWAALGAIIGGLAVAAATYKYGVEPHFHNSADWGALFKHRQLPHHHGRLMPFFTEHFDGSPHGVWSQAAPSPTPTPNVNPVTPTHDQVINALTGKDRPTSGPWTNTVYPKFDSPNVSGEHTMALSTHHEGRSLTDWYQGDAGLSRHRTVDGVGVDRLDEVAKATGLKIDKNHADYQSMIDDFRGRLQRLGDITNSEARQLRVGKIIPTFSDRETFSFLNLDKYSGVVDASHAAKITNLNTVLGPEHAVLDLGTVSQHTTSTLGHTSLAGLENSKGHLELGGYSVGLSPTEAGANAHTGWGAVSDYLSQYTAELPHANLEFQEHMTRLTAEANNVSIGERRPGYILDTELPVGFRWFLPSREQLMAEYHAWWQQTEEVRRLAQKDLALAS